MVSIQLADWSWRAFSISPTSVTDCITSIVTRPPALTEGFTSSFTPVSADLDAVRISCRGGGQRAVSEVPEGGQ